MGRIFAFVSTTVFSLSLVACGGGGEGEVAAVTVETVLSKGIESAFTDCGAIYGLAPEVRIGVMETYPAPGKRHDSFIILTPDTAGTYAKGDELCTWDSDINFASVAGFDDDVRMYMTGTIVTETCGWGMAGTPATNVYQITNKVGDWETGTEVGLWVPVVDEAEAIPGFYDEDPSNIGQRFTVCEEADRDEWGFCPFSITMGC